MHIICLERLNIACASLTGPYDSTAKYASLIEQDSNEFELSLSS